MDTGKSVVGTVSTDPLHQMPIGGEVNFRLVQSGRSNATEKPDAVKNWEYFNGAVTGLALKHAESCDLIGTAIIVAPGIAITATHNVSNMLDDMKRGMVVPYCFGVRANELVIWKVAKLNFNDSDDITFLSLEAASKLPDDRTYYQLGITTRAPRNGDELNIIGFRSGGFVTGITELRGSLYTARGKVTAVYPNGRDKLLLPYSAIELNCGSLGGMSGGAALDQSGLLIGIISRGWETDRGDGPTYISWIIGSMARSIEPVWPKGFYQTVPVSPLSINEKVIFIDRREALAGSTENEVNYKVWFE